MNITSKDLDQLKLFAHRGFGEDVLENSYASFDAALQSGCAQIELDVRTSSDDIFYISHDDSLYQMTGTSHLVSETDSYTLDDLLLTNGERFHRLSAIFDKYDTDMLYLVEFKEPDASADLFYELMRVYPDLTSRVQIQSFYAEVLEPFQDLFPNMYKQLLIANRAEIEEALQMDFLDSLALEQSLLTPAVIEQIHAAGKECWAWTVDDPDTIEKLLQWGIDGVITDLSSATELVQRYT